MPRSSRSSAASQEGGVDRGENRGRVDESTKSETCTTETPTNKAPDKTGSYVRLEVPRWLFFGLSALVACMAVAAGLYRVYYGNSTWRGLDEETVERLLRDIGPEGINLFHRYDRDSDNYLSLEEFEPLIYRLLEVNVTGPITITPIEPGDEVVKLQAHFQPLVLETMTKNMQEGDVQQLRGLKAWTSARVSELAFGASLFKSFLPDTPNFKVGEPYDIVSYETSLFGTSSLSSNRYFPPKIPKNALIFHQLLTMFHPRPFLITRFGPQGTVAVVRAYNDDYLDIVFRIHAEFQLNEPPLHPFWFTPAQFTGHLIISRNASHVKYFHLFVPAAKKLNVDMEWLNGPKESENMEVDIGFMPQMELTLLAESQPHPGGEVDPREVEVQPDPDLKVKVERLKWTEEISEEEAARALEVKLYPFMEVPYYNFSSVFDVAKKEDKLVHSILLWGALDDQSC